MTAVFVQMTVESLLHLVLPQTEPPLALMIRLPPRNSGIRVVHSSTPPTHLPKLPLSLWTNCSITWPLQVVAALPAHEAQECASWAIAPAQVATVFHTSQANSVPVQAASVITSETCSQPWHAKLVPTHVASDTQAVVACQPLQA